jgi:oligopeptide transport system substrate-binding protein
MLVALGATIVLLSVVPAGSAPATTAPGGGTLLVTTPLAMATLDPALSGPARDAIWYATCATLTAFRDAPAPVGLSTRPEAAVGPPEISRDGRTYVFKVRSGLRFSDGSLLTAANFARALGRVLNPAMGSPGAAIFSDIRQVSASGLRLRITLNRPSGDLITRLALPFACPVPLGFPVNPSGVDLSVGSGPYYIARFVPASLLVLRRNGYYRGARPHHVDSVVVTMGGDVDGDIKAVEDGRADVLHVTIPSELRQGLAQRYGVNRKQLFRVRGVGTAALVLNSSSPLFEDNAPLRRAVNFAVDRAEIVRQTPSGFLSRMPTDQILPRLVPGWRDSVIYPLTGPNLPSAHRLAQGNLRGGQAILYTIPGSVFPDEAQVIVRNLRAIGLDVQVKLMSQDVIKAKAGIPGERYDMILAGAWCCPSSRFPLEYPDPASAIVRLLGGKNARKPAGNTNLAYFDVATYNRQMAAADRLVGKARFQAFSRLEADMMGKEAPWAPLYEDSEWLLVSTRVGCMGAHPVFVRDYAAMCLR